MNQTITPNPISLTTVHLHMYFEDIHLASGTGFTYISEKRHFLITNWHNVSGRHPQTKKTLSRDSAVPNHIKAAFRKNNEPHSLEIKTIPLYSDQEEKTKPVWLEHPKHGSDIDVVAVPLDAKMVSSDVLHSINKLAFDDRFSERIADDVFVVGYPFNDYTFMTLPIWKKASIASEPDVPIDDLPKMLIDTATRHGLSGSPVIMRRHGVHGFDGKVTQGNELIGTIMNFIGIYSGRIGDDELKAQLGIVWRAEVIQEIISGSALGT